MEEIRDIRADYLFKLDKEIYYQVLLIKSLEQPNRTPEMDKLLEAAKEKLMGLKTQRSDYSRSILRNN